MLKIKIPIKFQLEFKYVLDFLLTELSGESILYEMGGSLDDVHIILPDGNSLTIANCFFRKFEENDTYINTANLPTKSVLHKLDSDQTLQFPVLFGNPKIIQDGNGFYCGIDVIAIAFFGLSRWEEACIEERDIHGRIPSNMTIAGKMKFMDIPYVDICAKLLRNLLSHMGYKCKGTTQGFTVKPTHDVDRVYFPFHKILASSILRLRSLEATKIRTKLLIAGTNPRDCFDFLMDVSEKYELVAEFNFIAGGTSKFDTGRYCIDDHFILALLKKIKNRGHTIGFHPSYSSAFNPKQWKQELDNLKKVFSIDVRTGRQHYLRTSVPQTWKTWDDNGMKNDSSFGFVEQPGYRCGTGSEMPVFDIQKREVLKVREQPLVIMDGALAAAASGELAKAREMTKYYVNISKKLDMPLTILFHNSSFFDYGWQGWDTLYQEIFQLAFE